LATRTAAAGEERRARIEHLIGSLVRERDRLRRTGAEAALLVASEHAIAYWHEELLGSSHSGSWSGDPADRASTPVGGQAAPVLARPRSSEPRA